MDKDTTKTPKQPSASEVANSALLEAFHEYTMGTEDSEMMSTDFEVGFRSGWSAALNEAWRVINSKIQKGELEGSGSDQTAMRNGQILATNQIHDLIHSNIED